MMEKILETCTNPFVVVPLLAWAFAQVLKVIINYAVTKDLNFERLFGDGGMPSGHSATVSSLAVMCALVCGTGSVEFAIAAILAIIVCHDATGVRRETGKQAVLLNELIKAFKELEEDKLPEVKLKEFVGHTPIQVIFGILIGVSNAFVLYAILF